MAPDRIDPMVHVMDVFSASIAAAGVQLPKNLDGADLFRHLTGVKRGPPHSPLRWLYNDHKEWRIPGRDTNLARPFPAIREEDWKLIMGGDRPPELYALAKDPGEAHNIASDHLDVVERLATQYRTWRAEMKRQVIASDHPLSRRYKGINPKQ